MTKNTIFVVDDEAQRTSNEAYLSFLEAVDRAMDDTSSLVAFDCQGINLSRIGTVEIVSISIESSEDIVYLLDMGPKRDADLRQDLTKTLKCLLESQTTRKIVHDCRMDCDALFHLHGIRVNNVHDTSCYHTVLYPYQEDSSLNKTLENNGFAINSIGNRDVYKYNPAYWGSRPLTAQMKEWASGDVDKLLELARKQEDAFQMKGSSYLKKARDMSGKWATHVVNMALDTSVKCRIPTARFIGSGGSNVRSVCKRTGTVIYQDRGAVGSSWMVFYSTQDALNSVRRAMGDTVH